MKISGTSCVNFNGLWEPIKTIKKDSGTYNLNKVFYTLHELVYHPWTNETQAEITQNVAEKYFGRSFSLWDKFDGHHKCDHFQMNRVIVGNTIDRAEQDTYLKRGWREKPIGGVKEKEEFYNTYDNDAYAPYDERKMDREYVDEIIARHFDIKS